MTATVRRQAHLKAMDYLARRDHSTKELRQKLKRFFPEDVVEEAIEYCSESGWIMDPVELAEKVAESLDRKRKSHFYIQMYLKDKGLPKTAFFPENELEKALKILQLAPRKKKDPKKLYSLLKNRGFDRTTIKRVMNEVQRNP